MIRIIKKATIGSMIALLIVQAFLIPIVVYAEPIKNQENNLSEGSSDFEKSLEDTTEREPTFNFSNTHLQAIVGEENLISINSDKKVSSLNIFLPEEAIVLKDKLPIGISVEQIKNSSEWLIRSEKSRIEFILPLLFKQEGSFELSVGEKKMLIDVCAPRREDEESFVDDTLPDSSVKSSTVPENLEENSSIEVNTFEEFQAAIRNDAISYISVKNDIAAPSTATVNLVRRSSLTVEGNGNTITMQNNYISVPNANLPQGGELVFNNIDFIGLSGPVALIQISINAPQINRWNAKFNNITTSTTINRLVWNTFGRVELSGNINLNTRFENIITSDVKIEDNTKYFGLVNFANVSIVYFEGNPRSDDISYEKNAFDIGENSFVQLGQTQTAGTTYPAVYLFYKQLTVGRNATFNVTMPGNAVRLQTIGARMDVKSGAVVNLTSRSRSGSVIAFSRNNTSIHVDPDAEFYVIGNSTRPLIDMASNDLGTAHVLRSGNKFVLNQPKNFDIRNLTSGNASTAIALSTNNNSNNEFSIKNSDIDLWNVSSDPLGISDISFSEVSEFTVTGRGTLQNISTSNDGLNVFNQNSIRRISGMSQMPEVIFDEDITDAHLRIKARVIVGYVPDNEGANPEGEVNYIPVYASKGQATGTIVDTFGVEHSNLITDSEGYISYTSDDFNVAGKTIIAQDVKVGSRESEKNEETIVVDVTPPIPAKINGNIYEDTKEINGTSEETNIRVDYTINGVPAKNSEGKQISTVVDLTGKWTLPIIEGTIVENDEIQIFLTDDKGNRNPVTEEKKFDAVFPEATKTKVLFNATVKPLDPITPEMEVNPDNKPELPENQGLLSIDFVSQFNFGKQSISVKDQTYYAQTQRLLDEDGTVIEEEERPNYIQISDRRREEERNGWALAVTQREQFQGETKQQLTGAQLRIANQQLVSVNGEEEPSLQLLNPLTLIPGNKRTLLRAEESEGKGTWIYRFGNSETAAQSVSLTVPKGANPEATSYSTTLLWELSAVPGN